MSSKRWLKAEIRKWVQNDLITPSEGNAILAQYEEESHSYQDIFFIMASLSIGGGLLSLGASFWNGLTQGQRFVTAMIPLLLSALLMLALVALDRKVPVTGHWKNVVRRRMETAYMDESDREEETVTRYRVPDYAREILCAFHGGSLLLACYLLEDTFFIPGTLPLLLLGAGVILLILTFLMDSLSLSVACVLAATAAAVTGGHDWIVTASWGLMAALVPFLLTLLKNDRQYSLIVLSWCWTAGVLFLISRTTNMLWEMMFFSQSILVFRSGRLHLDYRLDDAFLHSGRDGGAFPWFHRHVRRAGNQFVWTALDSSAESEKRMAPLGRLRASSPSESVCPYEGAAEERMAGSGFRYGAGIHAGRGAPFPVGYIRGGLRPGYHSYCSGSFTGCHTAWDSDRTELAGDAWIYPAFCHECSPYGGFHPDTGAAGHLFPCCRTGYGAGMPGRLLATEEEPEKRKA